MTTRVYDVIVIGAGPAGAGTAARLHQQGVRDVLVLERYRLPRDKPCGGGLTGPVEAALAALDLKLDVAQVASTHARVRFGAFERAVSLARPVRMVRRIEFDGNLVAQIRARGIEVRDGEGVKALHVERDHVTLKLVSGAELRARVVVGADGAASIVRRHLRRGGEGIPHRLFMQELPAPGRDHTMVYDFSLMAKGLRGYLWTFPVHGDRINVGIMQYPSQRRDGALLVRALREGLAPHGVQLPDRGAQGWPVWAYHPGGAVAAPRLLTVGDAAGIDALTGEGISVALEHAQLAGDFAARALATGDYGFGDFRRAMRRADVGRELARETLFAGLLYQRGENWRRWLSLLLFDDDVFDLYAAKVSGTALLSGHNARLLLALARHAVAGFGRARRLDALIRECAAG